MFDFNEAGGDNAYPLPYRNLMLVGLLGSTYRQHEDATIALDTVEHTLTDLRHFRMCRAIALGVGGDAEGAETALAQHIESHPDDDSSKVALGVALMLAGRPGWKAWIDNVLATSSDQTARAAAHGVMKHLVAAH
jgi:hypothetical protein